MSWFILVLAGLLEIVWAIGLKHTDGFTRPLPSALTLVAIAASLWLLATAARTLPIGTAYAVWVGIGVVGSTIGGMLLMGEPASLTRLGLLALLAAAIVGLKVTA